MAADLQTILVIAVVSSVLAGIALLWFGLRGRRVGDHPFCRKCGFDLFGRPEGSTTCAECGADLGAARSMVVGVRHRRRGAVVGGVTLLVPALAVGGVLGWAQGTHVDWQKQKPDWWLTREANSPVVSTRDDALKELLVRMRANQLPQSRVAQLVQRALQYQADSSKAWAPLWGDVVESARAANQVSGDDWQKYAEQGVASYYRIAHRKKLRRHDELTFHLNIDGARFGSSGRWYMEQVLNSVEIGPRNVSLLKDFGYGSVLIAPPRLPPGRVWIEDFSPEKGLLKELADGTYTGYIRLDLAVTDARQQRVRGPRRLRSAAVNTDDGFLMVHQRLPFRIEIVPDDGEILEPIVDEGLRQRVVASLKVSRVRLSGAALSARLDAMAAPVDLAFEVIGVVNGRECKLGMFAARQGETIRSPQTLSCPLPWNPDRPRVDAIDIIFRPETAAATGRLDIESYWKHEIVMKDVEVDDLLHHSAAEIREREERVMRNMAPTATTTAPAPAGGRRPTRGAN